MPKEHAEHPRAVPRKPRQHGVKLKACKCNLPKREVHPLGRTLLATATKQTPQAKPIEQPKETTPKTAGEARQLAGIPSHHRRSIRNPRKDRKTHL